ncbi:major facilitator superfamily domain-containing protein [Tricharina praecox]|uniref:major facilitator superfamily domain-containing protein n=1 Tax=Tricharina praecox TaxID=43433 RepID=UPI00221EF63B|nr:major facilitator superfamily domain-containing protein [Tricharina praecox]KAI5852016.1 major facilitator superfamily domain-containing protein [Tricharina praecox]
MPVGIVEPKSGHHVPGTARLFEDSIVPVDGDGDGEAAAHHHNHLKHGSGKEVDILLIPQPSNSPNDPLNWPMWKRDLTMFTLCLASAIAAIVGPAVAPIHGVLVKEFDTSYAMVSRWSGWQFWASGVAGLIASAVSRIWGKRPVYLVSILLVFIGVLWNGFSQSGDSFLGARFVEGLGLGAFEMLVPSSIGDLFFVHQRGKRVALYNLSFLGCTYFMPVLGGYISMKHGWRTQFYIMAGFLGVASILVFLFVPEHAYNRPAIFDTDTSSRENLSELDEQLAAAQDEDAAADSKPEAGSAAVEETKRTYLQELGVYNGRFSDESIIRCLLAPFVLFIYPATLWSFLFQGTFITWGIGVSLILAQLFTAPPYNFNPTQLGYMYAAPFIGAILSYFAAGVFSDVVAKWMAKRNNNIYEPEFRILLVIPVAVFALPGIFAFGYATEAATHWIAPSICYGLLTFGVVMSCTATFSYMLDAHRDISVEMMVSVLLLKNFWAFGSTFFVNKWVAAVGAKKMFYIIGAIQAVICVLSIGMYVYGKVQRDLVRRWNPLDRVGLYPKTVQAVAH